MPKLAYGITEAAEAASVTEHAVRVAINESSLSTRNLNGVSLILRSDLQAWLEALPRN